MDVGLDIVVLDFCSVSCITCLNNSTVPNYSFAYDVVLPWKSHLSMGSAELVLFRCLHKSQVSLGRVHDIALL